MDGGCISLRATERHLTPCLFSGWWFFWGAPGGGWADGLLLAGFSRAINDTMGGGGIIYKAAAYHYKSTAGA